MSEALRASSLALFAVGPVVAVLALLRRRLQPSPTLSRIRGWRWYVPAVLLPVEWLLPPALIALRGGQIEAGWLPVRVIGLAVGLGGAVLLVWASILPGRLMYLCREGFIPGQVRWTSRESDWQLSASNRVRRKASLPVFEFRSIALAL
jgi:hypothetical protein